MVRDFLFVKSGDCATVEILGRGIVLGMRAYRLASFSSQRISIIESGRARRTEIYRRVQTAMARTMASTFTRREDGMLKGRHSTKLQIWLKLCFLRRSRVWVRFAKGALFVKGSLREICSTSRDGRALVEAKQSKARQRTAKRGS